MFLRGYYIDQIQDWQRYRNRSNWWWGVNKNPCPVTNLLPFQMPNMALSGTNDTSVFKLQKLKILGKVKTIIDEILLSETDVEKFGGDNFDSWYYKANKQLTSPQQAEVTTGIYQYYLSDLEGNEFITEPFKVIFPCETLTVAGDFNSDFNFDFGGGS